MNSSEVQTFQFNNYYRSSWASASGVSSLKGFGVNDKITVVINVYKLFKFLYKKRVLTCFYFSQFLF